MPEISWITHDGLEPAAAVCQDYRDMGHVQMKRSSMTGLEPSAWIGTSNN